MICRGSTANPQVIQTFPLPVLLVISLSLPLFVFSFHGIFPSEGINQNVVLSVSPLSGPPLKRRLAAGELRSVEILRPEITLTAPSPIQKAEPRYSHKLSLGI